MPLGKSRKLSFEHLWVYYILSSDKENIPITFAGVQQVCKTRNLKLLADEYYSFRGLWIFCIYNIMHWPIYLMLVYYRLKKKCEKFDNFIATKLHGEAIRTSTQVGPLQRNTLNC